MTLVRGELVKIIFQKRTYIGWAALIAIPILISVALRFGGHGDNHDVDFFTLAKDNGLLVPLAATMALTTIFFPLVASMAGGYQLASEAESGTLKTWLLHPINRGPVVFSKWVTVVLYLLAGLALTVLTGYVVGIAFFGSGRMALLSGGTVSVAHGLGLSLLTYAYVLLAMIAVASIAMLISALTGSSLTAAIGTLVLVIVMQIIGQLSYFDSIKPYLLTSRMDGWQQAFFQASIDWTTVWKGVLTFVIYAAVAMVATWQFFKRKDVLV